MSLITCTIALAAVTGLYVFWRAYISTLIQKRRQLRERVAHLLWVMADLDEPCVVERRKKVDRPLDVV